MNYLGIKKENTLVTVQNLNKLLSNYQIYYQNLRSYHWTISGPHFFDLHEKFEELYNEAKNNIDVIAERILTLRMKPLTTMQQYLDNAEINEMAAEDTRQMVGNILTNHKILIENLRNVIKAAGNSEDEGTVDMAAGFLASLEKKSWMLDAWINNS